VKARSPGDWAAPLSAAKRGIRAGGELLEKHFREVLEAHERRRRSSLEGLADKAYELWRRGPAGRADEQARILQELAQSSAAATPPAKVPPLEKLHRRPPGVQVDKKKFRKLRGNYSQQDFAEKCDVGRHSIQRGERKGRLDQATLEKIAKHASELYGRSITADDLTIT
jgi:hypothetical protein